MKTKLFFIASAIVLLSACSQETPDINKYVTDCEGNVYPVVKIGYQYWMAENLKCTKYDTKSEKAGQTLSTSDNETDAPYYTDGRQTITDYSDNTFDSLIPSRYLRYIVSSSLIHNVSFIYTRLEPVKLFLSEFLLYPLKVVNKLLTSS